MNFVSEKISPDLLAKISDVAKGYSKAVSPEALKIKDEQKKGIRAMAEGREGYVRLMAKVATQYDAFLSKSDNAADLNDMLKYYDDLGSTRQALMELFEFIDGTQWGAGVECMKYAKRFNDSLESQRDNSAIDASMSEIDEWNSRFGKDGGEGSDTPENTAPEEGSV